MCSALCNTEEVDAVKEVPWPSGHGNGWLKSNMLELKLIYDISATASGKPYYVQRVILWVQSCVEYLKISQPYHIMSTMI